MKKVVLKVDVHDAKCKQKAMKMASTFTGLDSISMDMKEKKLTLIGDIDPVAIVTTNIAASIVSNGNASTHYVNIQCIHNEREALLQFKHDIEVDNCGLLSSWGDQLHLLDCCQWQGVHCDSHTNHVIRLTLCGSQPSGEPCLEGKLSASLLKLTHLKFLDLSSNDFRGQTIPSFIGSLKIIQHLNLSKASFSGEIPNQLGNLSNLASLDLTCDIIGNSYGCPYVNSLRWLSHLTSLKDIILSGIDLSKANDDWFQIVSNLPSLRVIHMDKCGLSPTIPTSISYTNSSTTISSINLNFNDLNDTSIFQWLFNLSGITSSLEFLDLSSNQIPGLIPYNFGKMISLSYLDLHSNLLEGPIPSAFWNMRNISYLSLVMNQLQGPVPHSIGSLCNLQELSLNSNNIDDELSNIIQALSSGCAHKSLVTLDLSQNRVWGSIPDTISTFSSLRILNLNVNNLNGTISQGIGQLSMLESLDISYNSLKDTLSHSHLSNLSRLRFLDLSNNPLIVVNMRADWLPPFQLININLDDCKLGPSFPKWLTTQTNVSYLSMSNAEISDTIPASFWDSISPYSLTYINVSHNMITGLLPDLSITLDQLPLIDLSSNNFSGAIPSFLRNSAKLYLNNNRLSDLSPFFCPKEKTSLLFLSLADNLFSGELPDCWMYFDQLYQLHLENNNFSKRIPASIGALTQLFTLYLRNNSLSGELPESFYNCTSIAVIDLGYNSLTGHIYQAIGHKFGSLRFLSLQSNKFHGSLPSSICQLSYLQVLDVSINQISGVLPKCMYNLTAMTSTDGGMPFLDVNSVYTYYAYSEYAQLMWKRKEQSFRKKSMGQMIAIDVSNNKLEGNIPEGISNLTGLVFLNLSRNFLSGSITSRIGQLTSLEFLDLSNNHLSGEIPTSLSQVTTLEILDLSNNNLSGKIPVGTQLQSFDSSAYTGNRGLCGSPLPNCPGDHPPPANKGNKDTIVPDDDLGLYVSIMLGFIIGFWGVCGTLIIKTSWRHALFRFLDDTKDKLYEMMSKKVDTARRAH